MNPMVSLFQEMLILVLLALAGYISTYFKILPVETKNVLTQLILYVTLPALIIFSMDVRISQELFQDMFLLILLSVYALTVATGLAYVMRKRSNIEKNREGVYEALVIFGNQGFIGYAVTFMLFGEIGVIYTAFFMLLYYIYIWTYAIYLVAKGQQKINRSQLIFNPGLVATLIGIIMMLFPFRWPNLVSNFLYEIGNMTVPLSMMLIGCLLAGIKGKEFVTIIINRYVWYVALAKLLIIPLFLSPFFLLPISSTVIMVAILVTGTPSAPTISMYAQKYGGDVSFSSVVVAVTTLLCLLTIPLLYGISLWLE